MNVNSYAAGLVTRLHAALMALLCLIVAVDATADKYAYGEDFARVGQSWADAGPPLAAPVPKLDSGVDQGESFHQQLAALEDSEGPYSDALAEPLTSLGRYYRASGDLEQATRMYRRALHLVRVNDGLYSERQMPVLRELLAVYRVTGDLGALDQRYEYYFRLYGNGQPPYTEVRLRAALGYLRWQREALRLGLDGDSMRRLQHLYRLNEDLLQATATDPSVSLAHYRDVVLSQVRNLYLLEDRVRPRLEEIGRVSGAPQFAQQFDQQDFDQRRLESVQRGALSRGSELLEELIGRYDPGADPQQVARLYLELGDWYQWHNSESRAAPHYTQAAELLTASGDQALLREWFGQPVELPDNGAFWQPPVQVNDQPPLVLEVAYDVSASGRASNLQSIDEDPAYDGKANRLKRALRQIRFRPRWVNGAAQSASVRRDYQLFD